VHMDYEEQIRYVMQCTETHVRCFLFTAERLAICVHMCNEKQVISILQCNETHLRCFLFIAQRLVITWICITRNKLDRSRNALKYILVVFFSLHRGYCVHTHNEKQVISIMQCTETHIRCFLFTAERLAICVHMHNEKQVISILQCNETHIRCFLFIAQRSDITWICITRNNLDRSCNAMLHILGVFFSLHRG